MTSNLRLKLLRSPELLVDFDDACALRLREADVLVRAGRYDGACYLLGYVAEMRLKLAAFRRLGAKPTDLVAPHLGVVRSWMKSHVPHVRHESFHSLEYWSVFLQLHPGRSIRRATIRSLRRHVNVRLFHAWHVDMRYRDCGRTFDDAWNALVDVWWIETHWTRL